MAVVVPIDSDKIVEILFENSEQFSNDIYVNLMNMMKIYHELENNYDSINRYIDVNKENIDKKVLKRIKRYIKQPPRTCETCERWFNFCSNFYIIIISLVLLIGFASVIIYAIVTKDKGPRFETTARHNTTF